MAVNNRTAFERFCREVVVITFFIISLPVLPLAYAIVWFVTKLEEQDIDEQ